MGTQTLTKEDALRDGRQDKEEGLGWGGWDGMGLRHR